MQSFSILSGCLDKAAGALPPDLRTLLCDLREYEAAVVIASLVGNRRKILVVGDFRGRESGCLRSMGKSVTVMDIAPLPRIPGLIVSDVTKSLPFRNSTFDCVVMSEVLEHVVEDHAALLEISRILAPEGALVAAVPYFNDEPEYHVRIHSKATITRLMRYCGFEPEWYLERGGLISVMRWQGARLVHAALARLTALLGRMPPWRGYFLLNRPAVFVDVFLARHIPRVLKWSAYYGVYIRAVKTKRWDYREVNIKQFSG